MKALNKTLIATAIAVTLTAAGATAFAKGGMGGQGDPATRMSYIFTQLELTETQQADVLAVLEAVQEEHRQAMWDQMQALRDQEDRPTREEMQALRDAQQAAQSQLLTDKLNTVLSPEMTAELVEYLDFHRGPVMGGKQGGRGDGGRQGPGMGQNMGPAQGARSN